MIRIKNYEHYDKTFSYVFFLISVPLICIFPKVNIFTIPGFWQGVQLFDLLILVFMFYFIFNISFFNIRFGGQFTNLFLFFPYILFTSLIALLVINVNSNYNVHGAIQFNTTIIITIRFIEFLFFVILSKNYFNNKLHLNLLFQLFILINFFIAFLQEFNLLGYVNSRGFFSSGDPRTGGRPMGLTGGPWELGATASIAFFGIYFLNNKKIDTKIIFYFVLTLICLVFAETKSNFIGFIVALFFLHFNLRYFFVMTITFVSIYLYFLNGNTYFNIALILSNFVLIFFIYKKISYSLIYLIFVLFIPTVFFNYFLINSFLNKIILLDFIYLLKLAKNFFIYEQVPKFTETPNLALYYSLVIRLSFWTSILVDFKSSLINMIFGMGNQKIYYESFILRCIFTFGFLGSLLIIYLSRKLPIFFIVFTIFAGTTFDLYFSSKVFFLTILFFIAYRKYYLNKE